MIALAFHDLQLQPAILPVPVTSAPTSLLRFPDTCPCTHCCCCCCSKAYTSSPAALFCILALVLCFFFPSKQRSRLNTASTPTSSFHPPHPRGLPPSTAVPKAGLGAVRCLRIFSSRQLLPNSTFGTRKEECGACRSVLQKKSLLLES